MSHMFVSEALNAYAEQYTSPESAVLAALNQETNEQVAGSVMLSGHLQGAFLSMISKLVHPHRILEIGTYTGYSAICLAQGLQEGGHLDTMELDQKLADIAARHFREAGVADRIRPHFGKAAELIPQLEGTFDLVFIDADKQGYPQYFDLVIDRMPLGGVILADNVLFHGEVILPEAEQSKSARAIHAFNEKIKEDRRVEQVVLPIRDGIALMRKIANQ